MSSKKLKDVVQHNGFTEQQLKEIYDFFTDDEIEEYRHAFSVFDQNGDGDISPEEMLLVMKSIGQIKSEKDIQDVIRTMDTDGDGLVDFTEFLFMVMEQSKLQQLRNEEELRGAFDVFDKDRDGAINKQDLKLLFTGLGQKITDDEVNEMMEEADIDRDGFINYDEFVAMLKFNVS